MNVTARSTVSAPRCKTRECVRAWAAMLALGVAMLALPGCPPRPPVDAGGAKLTPPPEYADLVKRYNANIDGASRLWSRGVIEMTWRDGEKKRFEQGDGNLVAIAPDKIALSIGKLGNTLLWAGCDGERYWLFDMNGDKKAMVGRHENVGKPCARPLPAPVHPRDMVRLLGVTPIDPAKAPPAPAVEWHEGKLLIEPPGTGTRLLLDATTALPVRIDLTDDRGRSRVICVLSKHEPMQVEGKDEASGPKVARRFEVTVPGREGGATLFLSDLSDGSDGDRIKDRLFDFDALTKALKPAKVEVLDEACGK